MPLDLAARRAILKSAKRVSVVTAISPIIWIAMIYVAVENLRMLRGLAGLYGGRPGTIGALRLARMVVTHIVATGGLAMTDDLLGQFLGQDLLRRVSRRLGEGAFNGALTARIGAAAVEVTRPLPYLDAEPVRARDVLPSSSGVAARTVPRPRPDQAARLSWGTGFGPGTRRACRDALSRLPCGGVPGAGSTRVSDRTGWKKHRQRRSGRLGREPAQRPRENETEHHGRHPDEKAGRGFPAEQGQERAGQSVTPVKVQSVHDSTPSASRRCAFQPNWPNASAERRPSASS